MQYLVNIRVSLCARLNFWFFIYHFFIYYFYLQEGCLNKVFDLQGFGHLLLLGSVTTIKLALTSLFFGLIFGFLGATAKLSSVWVLRKMATIYTSVMRGIPELLMIMFVYFGLTILLKQLLRSIGYEGNVDISKFWAGVIVLSVAFGAYATEVLRMAIQEIPEGQWEAAKAIGMPPIKTFFRIILPQVWALALPGLGNLFLVLIKDTALVSVIGLSDIMFYAQKGYETTKEPFTFYLAAAFLYLAITTIVTGILMLLEKRANPAQSYNNKLKKQHSSNLTNTTA